MKRESNLPDTVVNKSLKSLQAKQLIKEVVNIQNKGKKHYMAAEFEPSKEITGGEWYNKGSLDIEFISLVKDQCLKHIFRQKVDTLDDILEWIRKSKIFSVDITTKQIEEILHALVLDNEIIEVRRLGLGNLQQFLLVGFVIGAETRAAIKGNQKQVPWLLFHVEFALELARVHPMALSPLELVSIIRNG